MQEHVWDGVGKRDRLVWIGDMPRKRLRSVYSETATACAKSLDLIRGQHSPAERYERHSRIFALVAAYSSRQIHTLRSLEYLKEQHAYITELLHYFSGFITADGGIAIEIAFLDWPSSTNPAGGQSGRSTLCLVCEGCEEIFNTRQGRGNLHTFAPNNSKSTFIRITDLNRHWRFEFLRGACR